MREIKPIGDLSAADRSLLKSMAQTHGRILEGGAGGSTQILTHYTQGKVVSYESDQSWITKTIANFKKVGVSGNCEFRLLTPDMDVYGRYDFAFVDTAREYRLPFAIRAWNCLIPGGTIAFHDTRRDRDISNVLRFATLNFREIDRVETNVRESNITLITRRHKRAHYVNWNKAEKRTPEEIGIA